jgi:prepilin-type N-terminal cleavage/methylation domain-containing protein
MKGLRSESGFTIVEMAVAVVALGILSTIYFLMIDGYRERRMSEQAAKVLMLAAKAQEDYFAKEHHYFDAEISGNGDNSYLVRPDGLRTNVLVPPKVVLSIKTRKGGEPAFTGEAFYLGSRALHRYDSETG